MAGLLYKDFVAVKGKMLCLGTAAFLLGFLVLRLLFPGDTDAAALGIMMEQDGAMTQASDGVLYDMLFAMLILCTAIIVMGMPLNNMLLPLLRMDEKGKARNYIHALPLKRNTYIASKYLFIGIAYYVILAVLVILTMIYGCNAGENAIAELMGNFSGMLLVLLSTGLVLSAVELPFLITYGVKKGMTIKITIIFVLTFLLLSYMFFGDMTIVERLDINVLIRWCHSHSRLLTLVEIFMPVLSVCIYWISYKITCAMGRDREVELDG